MHGGQVTVAPTAEITPKASHPIRLSCKSSSTSSSSSDSSSDCSSDSSSDSNAKRISVIRSSSTTASPAPRPTVTAVRANVGNKISTTDTAKISASSSVGSVSKVAASSNSSVYEKTVSAELKPTTPRPRVNIWQDLPVAPVNHRITTPVLSDCAPTTTTTNNLDNPALSSSASHHTHPSQQQQQQPAPSQRSLGMRGINNTPAWMSNANLGKSDQQSPQHMVTLPLLTIGANTVHATVQSNPARRPAPPPGQRLSSSIILSQTPVVAPSQLKTAAATTTTVAAAVKPTMNGMALEAEIGSQPASNKTNKRKRREYEIWSSTTTTRSLDTTPYDTLKHITVLNELQVIYNTNAYCIFEC